MLELRNRKNNNEDQVKRKEEGMEERKTDLLAEYQGTIREGLKGIKIEMY